MTEKEILYNYLLILGDNSMILGHRLSELCGHGPSLETDIACTNISLDLFGQVRSYFQYAANIIGGEATEDTIAYFRNERQFRNSILVEQKNENFGHVICRQFLFDAYHKPLLEQLVESKDQQIAAIATKSLKESKYHKVFSSEWMKRLGDGTEESHNIMQEALDYLYPFCHELITPISIETQALGFGIGANLSTIKLVFDNHIADVLSESGLKINDTKPRYARGKDGMHTELMGPILAEFQSTQRAYPNLTW